MKKLQVLLGVTDISVYTEYQIREMILTYINSPFQRVSNNKVSEIWEAFKIAFPS